MAQFCFEQPFDYYKILSQTRIARHDLLQGSNNQWNLVVLFAKEARGVVVSALDDVQRYAIKVYTGSPGYETAAAETFEPLLQYYLLSSLLSKSILRRSPA